MTDRLTREAQRAEAWANGFKDVSLAELLGEVDDVVEENHDTELDTTPVTEAARRLSAVGDLHRECFSPDVELECGECCSRWPCPTRRILEGESLTRAKHTGQEDCPYDCDCSEATKETKR